MASTEPSKDGIFERLEFDIKTITNSQLEKIFVLYVNGIDPFNR